MSTPSYPGPYPGPYPGAPEDEPAGWAAPVPGGAVTPPPWTQDAPTGAAGPVAYPPAPYGAQRTYASQPYPSQPYPVQPYPVQPQVPVRYGYGPPMSPFYGDLAAPFGRDLSGRPLSDKSKVSAGLLQIFLGWLGAGRFYTGHTGIALGQLGLTVVGWLTSVLGIGVILVLGAGVWALVDGIVLLSSSSATDSRGLLLRS